MILLTLSSFSPASHWTLLLLVRSQATKYISSFYFSFLKLLRISRLLLSSLAPSLLAPTRTRDTDTATTTGAVVASLSLLLPGVPSGPASRLSAPGAVGARLRPWPPAMVVPGHDLVRPPPTPGARRRHSPPAPPPPSDPCVLLCSREP